jgi:hypothetical protein
MILQLKHLLILDLPLIAKGEKIRICLMVGQLSFFGWPDMSYGTFEVEL